MEMLGKMQQDQVWKIIEDIELIEEPVGFELSQRRSPAMEEF